MNRPRLVLLGLGAAAGGAVACALLLAAAGPLEGGSARAANTTPAPVGVTLVFTATPPDTLSGALHFTATAPGDTLAPSPAPSQTVTPGPSPTLTPFPPDHPPEDHFWFSRPIPDGYVNYVDRNYLYGTTQHGRRMAHRGVDMQSPAGTPVLAAGPGTVIFAGPDWEELLGPQLFFYGNAVVIEHEQRFRDLPVYTLYGHLERVDVAPGRQVSAGDLLGGVGGTGVALGPHLHFEVRVGANNYESTRNPELWLLPFPRWGALAGRVLDSRGDYVPEIIVDVRSLQLADPEHEPVVRFVTTYAADAVNGDDEWQENFVLGDLPPGVYSVAVSGQGHPQTVTVTSERTAWVVLVDRER